LVRARDQRRGHPAAHAWWLVGAAALGCSGTGGGGTGDPPAKPHPTELGDGSKISELVGPAKWENPAQDMSQKCSKPSDRNVYVTGATVTAIDRFDETTDGSSIGNYYAEDTNVDPAQYSGVEVYSPGFSPPDLRLSEGDVVDMLGVLQEFPGPASAGLFPYCRTLPEFGGTLSFRFDTGVVQAKTIPLSDLTSYDTARKWLGMLVRIEAVAIAGVAPPSKGRYTADINVGAGVQAGDVPQISNELYDLEQMGPALAAGTSFKAVTGIVTYFYKFHIAPRSPADFEQ